MINRRTFIARSVLWSAAFVAGVRLAIEGACVDFAAPESTTENIRPAVEASGLRINPETLDFEFQTATGWYNTGKILEKWVPAGSEGQEFELTPIDAEGFRKGIVNGCLVESWKVTARPKKDFIPLPERDKADITT